MPTSYVGDPTATQAPSAPPNPDVFPTVNIPIATEGRTISSIEQMFKTGADFIAWLMRPRAKASAWAESIRMYRSASLKRRFEIDHQGFPGGRIMHYREDWWSLEQILSSSPATVDAKVPDLPRWNAYLNSTGVPGNAWIKFLAPDTTVPFRRVQLRAGGNGVVTVLSGHAPCLFTDDNHISFEFDCQLLLDATLAGCDAMVGLFGGEGLGGAPNSATRYLRFRKANGTANWLAETSDGTTPTSVDTGVAGNLTFKRFGIYWHGANVGDGGARRAVFTIDEAPVANITTGMPHGSSASLANPAMIVKDVTGSSGTKLIEVGPLRLSNNLHNLT